MYSSFLRLRLNAATELLKMTATKWSQDKAQQMGAALAFYSLFSFGPVILVSVAIASLFYGREAAGGQIVGQLKSVVGTQAGEAIQSVISNAHHSGSGFLAGMLGILMLFIGASSVFGQLQDALNTIWKTSDRAQGSLPRFVKEKFLSFAMVISLGFLLLISLVISAALAALGKYFTGLLPSMAPLLEVINFLMSFAITASLFAMIYKILPAVHLRWKDVFYGAVMTSVLFTVGKFLIGLYLGRSAVGSTYGAAGSLIVLSLWVYYSAQIVFFGAELTQVYATQYGSRR